MSQKSLFRQKAVDKMLSPDELDSLMRVVDPKGWLALVALFAMVVPAVVWGVFGTIPTQVSGNDGILLHRDALHGVVSQSSGIVTHVQVTTGDAVRDGQVIARIRADSGAEADVVSLFRGRVVDLAIDTGMLVDRGQQIAVVEEAKKPLEAVFFVPAKDGTQLKAGMQVHVSPSTAKAEEFGYLQGKISSVSQLPVTEGDMLRLLEDQSLVDTLRVGTDQLEVDVELILDPATPSGFKWSSSRGPRFPVAHGTPCSARFVLGEQHPVSLIKPGSSRT